MIELHPSHVVVQAVINELRHCDNGEEYEQAIARLVSQALHYPDQPAPPHGDAKPQCEPCPINMSGPVIHEQVTGYAEVQATMASHLAPMNPMNPPRGPADPIIEQDAEIKRLINLLNARDKLIESQQKTLARYAQVSESQRICVLGEIERLRCSIAALMA
jgi:hypothetical protein